MYRNPVDNTISRIVLPISTVVFDMELRGFITVVEGWSGTGKTFFLNSLKSFYMNNKNMIRQKFGLQGILFYDFNDIDKDILFAVKRVKGYLILIDNALGFNLFPKHSGHVSSLISLYISSLTYSL